MPICIITAGGIVKCAASKVKQHFPAGHKCVELSAPHQNTVIKRLDRMAVAAKARKAAATKGPKRGTPASEPDVFAKVIEIMIAAGVTDRTRFTIVKAP